MKIILDLAVSADGFIAKLDGNSDWVAESSENIFRNRVRELGCLVVGSRTFEQYKGEIYPVQGALNIVLSSNTEKTDAGVVYATSPEQAVQSAESHGCKGILIAGGGSVAGTFLKRKLIDEVFFTVHPIVLGEGMKPFGTEESPRLILLDSQKLENGLVQNHYRVEK